MSALIFIILIYMLFMQKMDWGSFLIYLITLLHLMTSCNREHIFNTLNKFAL